MKVRRNIIPTAITALILIALLISGNASAFIVDFKSDKEKVVVGEKVNYDLKIDVEANDSAMGFFGLNIMGPEDHSCKIDLNGTLLTTCKGVEVIKTNETDFKTGYGYGYGGIKKSVEYKIILDTLSYKEGDYGVEFLLKADAGDISKTIPLTIDKAGPGPKEACSIRAKNGDGMFNGYEFEKNKLNFFISQKNAKKGSGSLVMQDRGKRVSISFGEKDVKVIGNSSKFLILSVSGTGRFNRDPVTLQEAIIRVDKINMKASVFDNDGNVIVKDMDVTFIKGC